MILVSPTHNGYKRSIVGPIHQLIALGKKAAVLVRNLISLVGVLEIIFAIYTANPVVQLCQCRKKRHRRTRPCPAGTTRSHLVQIHL